jgi:hypothetical protein
MIRGVKINEISLYATHRGLSIITSSQSSLGLSQSLAYPCDVILIEYFRVHVMSKRNIEFSFGIHSIETVVACLVQKNEPGATLNGVWRIPGSDLIVKIFLVWSGPVSPSKVRERTHQV